MERSKRDSLEGIRSVKAAISLYGQKFNGKKQQDMPTKSGELHLAKMDIHRLDVTKKSSETEKARAEAELVKAKSVVKELSVEIERIRDRAMVRKSELHSSRRIQIEEEDSELIKELRDTKREISRLKLDLVSVSESKAKAEKEIEDSNSRVMSCMSAIEKISKEIEEANEEHALVELARIEAEREFREIEAQRKLEAAKYSKEVAEAKEKLRMLQEEAEQAKDLESKVAATNTDLVVLQSEMELVRAMDTNFKTNRTEEFVRVETELYAAKQELAIIKEEGFQYMASMDVTRDEMMLIIKESEMIRKQEKKADSTIQQLNSKLLKARSKLELASAAEERTKAIVSNLSTALQELQIETEGAMKEKEMIADEIMKTKLKVELTCSKTLSTEEKLHAVVQELAAAKTSEAVALQKMRDVAEKTMKNRANLLIKSPTITISKAEYDYLKNSAASAQAVADMKVEASRAWIEALQAEEKEISMRTEIIKKEVDEQNLHDEQQNSSEDGESDAKEDDWLSDLAVNARRKSMKGNRASAATAKKSTARRSLTIPAIKHHVRSPSIAVKKKTALLNLAKFLPNDNAKTHI